MNLPGKGARTQSRAREPGAMLEVCYIPGVVGAVVGADFLVVVVISQAHVRVGAIAPAAHALVAIAARALARAAIAVCKVNVLHLGLVDRVFVDAVPACRVPPVYPRAARRAIAARAVGAAILGARPRHEARDEEDDAREGHSESARHDACSR